MLRSLLALIAIFSMTQVSAGALEDNIAQRLAPVGSVCIEGEECDAANGAAAAASSAPAAARSGEQVYNSACAGCHATGAAGAPKFADSGAWADRIGKGIDTLYTNALNGINGMPAKGLCMDCSEDEIKATVDYLVENAK